MNRMYCADARELESVLPFGLKHRLCITSPPYWMLRDYDSPLQIGMEKTPEEFIDNLTGVFKSAYNSITPDGSLVIVIGDSYFGGGSSTKRGNDFNNFKHKSTLSGTHPGGSKRPVKPKIHHKFRVGEQVGIPWMLADSLRKCGWMIRQVSIWAKPNPMPGPFRKRLTSSHEYIIHATKGMSYLCNRSAIDDGERIMRDVITCAVSKGGHRHNAGFPRRLIDTFISAFTNEGDFILDPFMGSGTVADACVASNRFYTGIDINAKFGSAPNSGISGKPSDQD
jgi:site-specific DNA-methyltransferase (cytosine-N4-specific)